MVSLSAPTSPSPDVAILPPREARRFDLVVWGATGFTGKLVAEYIARHHQPNRTTSKPLSWALAGRSREKLEAVRTALTGELPGVRDVPLLLANSDDRASLDRLARDARVVITTVGPYALYGRALAAACVDAGTDYVDLAGETPFIRDLIDAHHANAARTGARIVNSCGYDSIPSDLGVLMLQEYAQQKYGAPCAEVRFLTGETKGGPSGGTVASALNLLEEASKDPRVRKLAANPYALDPDRQGRGPDQSDQLGLRFDAESQRWTAPFVMAAINTRIVRRSNALLGYAYGRDFRYSEATGCAAGPKGFVQAAALTGATAAFLAAASLRPVRTFLSRRVLPAPGEGPSREARENGYFTSRLYGTVVANGKAVKLVATVKAKGDPGYAATARMLSESAICLLRDDGIRQVGGVLTPASCMGMALVERLREAGMTFEVRER